MEGGIMRSLVWSLQFEHYITSFPRPGYDLTGKESTPSSYDVLDWLLRHKAAGPRARQEFVAAGGLSVLSKIFQVG